MSSHRKLIFLSAPLYGEKREKIVSRGYECGYCHGAGGYWGARCSPHEGEWKPCPVCEGCGKLDAEVTIEWIPNKTINKKQ